MLAIFCPASLRKSQRQLQILESKLPSLDKPDVAEYYRGSSITMHQLVTLVTILLASSWLPRGHSLSVFVSGPNAVARMKLPANHYLNASGDAYLVMQPDCILYTYKGSTALAKSDWAKLWSQNKTQPPGLATNWNCYLDHQADGNFVVYTWNGTYVPEATQPLWAADTASNGYVNSSHRFVVLGSDGGLTMYGPDFSKLSMPTQLVAIGSAVNVSMNVSMNESGVLPRNLEYPFPAGAAWKPNVSLDGFPYLPAEYYIDEGARLEASAGGNFHLVLETDCTLKLQEVWPGNNTVKQVIWAPPELANSTQARSGCQLTLQPNGVLQVKNNGTFGTVYWSSTPAGDPSVNWVLKLNADRGGYLVVCDILDSNTQLWSSVAGSSSGRNNSWWWIVVGLVSGVLTLVAAGLVFWFCYARDKFLDPVDKAFQRKMQTAGFSQTWYSESKIKLCTDDYAHKIGQGGFGDVFYGKLPDGQEIAAKVLSAESCQSKQEFYNEIELLSTVHHKYLVTLLGYRCTRRQQILIYEYLSGGDLRQRLQGENSRRNPLSWRQRTSILLQVSEGLEYLHDKCSPSIIHRDVKSNNILLTSKMVAKVADFGLSKIRALDQEDATHITTIVKGTPGYLDPEYHETGMLTAKSDVYAFGIVVMEVLTGRTQMSIVQRVEEAWRSERLEDLPDPTLGGDLDTQEFVKLVELSLWCVRKRNEERPFMRQVLQNMREIGLALVETSKPDMDFLNDDHCSLDTDIIFDSASFSKSNSFNIFGPSNLVLPNIHEQASMPFRHTPTLHHNDYSR